MSAKSLLLHISSPPNDRDKWVLRVLGSAPAAFKAQFAVVESKDGSETPFLVIVAQNKRLTVMETIQYHDRVRQQIANEGGTAPTDSTRVQSTAAARANLMAGSATAPPQPPARAAAEGYAAVGGGDPGDLQFFGGFGTAGGGGLNKHRGMDLRAGGGAGGGAMRPEDADRVGANEATLQRARRGAIDELFRSAGMTDGAPGAPVTAIVPVKEGKEAVNVEAMLAERQRREDAIRAQQRNVPLEPPTSERRATSAGGFA